MAASCGRLKLSITIKDVAKKAGVSIATVSHVMHKSRYVSEGVTGRVNQAISDLNYYPNLLVGSMRKKKTFTIGLIIPNISNETFGKLSENIQRILFEKNYNLIICNTSNSVDIEIAALRTLLTKKVDGIIAIPTTTDSAKFEEIKKMEIPLIFVDRIISGFEVDTVVIDNFLGTYEAINYLIKELGHKTIGYIDRPSDHSHSIEQKNGYKKALQENGIIINDNLIVRPSGFDYLAGVDAVKDLIAKNPKITAVFAYYDIIALGAMRGIIEAGFKIPDDISLTGEDNIEFAKVCRPGLTTINNSSSYFAENATKMFFERIEGIYDGPPREIICPRELVVRDSTKRI